MNDSLAASQARAIAFEDWMRTAYSPPGAVEMERPEQELLAEHHMMGLALSAMETEARQLLRGAPLRPDFWRVAVDFIGNFTHRVHRVKEEDVLFPALQSWGLLAPDRCQHFEEDHEALGGLTRELCDGVDEGDWEKAFRVVSIYLDRIRPHLTAEEGTLLMPELVEIPVGELAPIQQRFREIETHVLGAAGRSRILALSQQLRRSIHFTDLHEPVESW